MFLKICLSTKNGKTYPYYQIVQSYRENGKVKHKRIANIGNISEKDADNLIRGLQKIKKKPISLEEAKLRHKKILIFGEIEILNYLWDRLEISEILSSCCSLGLKNVQFDIAPYIKVMTFFRLLEAGSELKLAEWFPKIYLPEITVLEYYKLLRALGYVTRIKNEIEKQLFQKQKDLFHLEVDLVFYDITSTYFESEGPGIAKPGYSRDKRKDRNQVLIALAVTKEGFPIGHEVLEGNLQDKSTVKYTIDTLEKRFEIDKCIFVGDRGMVSAENIEYIEKKGYTYIFAIRRRRLYEAEEVIEGDLSKYCDFIEYDVDGNEKKLKYLEVIEGGVKYVVCHNPERAQEDLNKVEEKVEKIKAQIEEITRRSQAVDKMIKRMSRIYNINRFYQYGLDKEKKFYHRFKEEAYAYEKLIAGKYVLKTNDTRLSCEEILQAYNTLGRVEDAFRDIKDYLEVRPIFHRKEENVRGHIFITVLSYLLEKALERCFYEEGKNRITTRRILRHLSDIRLVVNEIDGHTFGRVTEVTREARAILKKLGIKKFQDTYYLREKEVKLPDVTIYKLKKYDVCSR